LGRHVVDLAKVSWQRSVTNMDGTLWYTTNWIVLLVRV